MAQYMSRSDAKSLKEIVHAMGLNISSYTANGHDNTPALQNPQGINKMGLGRYATRDRARKMMTVRSELRPQHFSMSWGMGLGVSLFGFCSATKQFESTTFVVPGICVLWINLNGLIEGRDCLIELALHT